MCSSAYSQQNSQLCVQFLSTQQSTPWERVKREKSTQHRSMKYDNFRLASLHSCSQDGMCTFWPPTCWFWSQKIVTIQLRTFVCACPSFALHFLCNNFLCNFIHTGGFLVRNISRISRQHTSFMYKYDRKRKKKELLSNETLFRTPNYVNDGFFCSLFTMLFVRRRRCARN